MKKRFSHATVSLQLEDSIFTSCVTGPPNYNASTSRTTTCVNWDLFEIFFLAGWLQPRLAAQVAVCRRDGALGGVCPDFALGRRRGRSSR